MTNTERVQAVCALGYTERQAGFLFLAALISGHFVRRQFNTYLGRECGAVGQSFIEKLLDKGHATQMRLCTATIVYHLHARALYAALGEEENRNRREHAPGTVKRRLMSLDFALESGARFFATREERRALLQPYGLDQCCLEKHPLFTAGSEAVCLGYVDEGVRTLGGFWTFLQTHRNIFSAVPGCQVGYISGSRLKCSRAESLFERFTQQFTGSSQDNRLSAALEHFRARQKFEARDFSAFSQSALDRFRKDRQVYSGPGYDLLYKEWERSGDQVLLAAPEFRPVESTVRFSAYILGDNYELFGGFRKEGES